MNHKKKLLYLVAVFFIVLLFGYLLMNASRVGICPAGSACLQILSEFFGAPLVIGSAFILISFLCLFFVQKDIYYSWKKFVVWFLPLWILLVALTPTQGKYEVLPFMELDKSVSSIGIGIIYLIISLAIIIYQAIKSRKSNKSN